MICKKCGREMKLIRSGSEVIAICSRCDQQKNIYQRFMESLRMKAELRKRIRY